MRIFRKESILIVCQHDESPNQFSIVLETEINEDWGPTSEYLEFRKMVRPGETDEEALYRLLTDGMKLNL